MVQLCVVRAQVILNLFADSLDEVVDDATPMNGAVFQAPVSIYKQQLLALKPLVVDNGSGVFKIGLGGESLP